MKESSLQAKIVRELTQRGAYVTKAHAVGFGLSGVPDLLVCYGGSFIALEVKGERRGSLTKMQRYQMERIRAAGGIAEVVRSVDDALNVCAARATIA